MDRIITTGIASFGMSGKVFHAPLLTAHNGFRLKAIVERTKNEVKGLYPNINSVRTIDDLLKDPEIELVIINTPDHTHYELAKIALQAGKHVVVEKPFTQKVSQAEDLLNLAHKKNKILSVFQNRRWDGDFLTVRDIINSGKLGRLVEFEAHFDRFRNYIQPDTWKEDASFGAGTLYNLGSHLIDQALVLFGIPDSVWADIRILRTDGQVDDFFEVILFYNKVRVALKASYLVREPGPRYVLNGTNGSFIKYGLDPQEDLLKIGKSPNEPNWGIETKENWGLINTEFEGKQINEKVETIAGNYLDFYDSLYNAICFGYELAVKPEEALNVIQVIEAAIQSNKEGKRIKL